MSTTAPPIGLFSALDMAVLERMPNATYSLLSESPSWLLDLWPSLAEQTTDLNPAEVFLFLDHFFVDAEVFWASQETGVLSSGVWAEESKEGQAVSLEALALRYQDRPILLIKFPTTDFATTRHILQESRNQTLELHRLLKEVDKREVLLHCIVHDLSTPLAGIKGSLQLLREDEMVVDEGDELLGIGLNQVEKMQSLIREILASFAKDVQPILPTLGGMDTAPDIKLCALEVTEALGARAIIEGVTLRCEVTPPDGSSWKVRGDVSRLERVFFNLIENAIRHTAPGTEVSVHVEDEGAFVRASVHDRGSGVPAEQVDSLFKRFSQGQGQRGNAGLGLYYCRITVESWGGTIRYEDRPGGGACFTIRLPKQAPVI